MAQYKVVCPISSSGLLLKVGDIVDFFGDEAERLLKSGAIEEIKEPFANKTAPAVATLHETE